jgi:hypothetical protein
VAVRGSFAEHHLPFFHWHSFQAMYQMCKVSLVAFCQPIDDALQQPWVVWNQSYLPGATNLTSAPFYWNVSAAVWWVCYLERERRSVWMICFDPDTFVAYLQRKLFRWETSPKSEATEWERESSA